MHKHTLHKQGCPEYQNTPYYIFLRNSVNEQALYIAYFGSLNIAVIKAKIHYKQLELRINVSERLQLNFIFSQTHTMKLVNSLMRAEDWKV